MVMCAGQHHLSFAARRDSNYLYIRCQDHPEIVFMIDATEEYLLSRLPTNTGSTWYPLLHTMESGVGREVKRSIRERKEASGEVI